MTGQKPRIAMTTFAMTTCAMTPFAQAIFPMTTLQ